MRWQGRLMLGVGECGWKWRGALILTLVTVAMLEAQGQTPLYRQPNAPVDVRVSDLVKRSCRQRRVRRQPLSHGATEQRR